MNHFRNIDLSPAIIVLFQNDVLNMLLFEGIRAHFHKKIKYWYTLSEDVKKNIVFNFKYACVLLWENPLKSELHTGTLVKSL